MVCLQISDIILVPRSHPPYIPSHSKWTHNCRSSGETVTNCRESPIYDVSSEQPLQHLFLGDTLSQFQTQRTKAADM